LPRELAAGVGRDELAVSPLGEPALDEPPIDARVRVRLLSLGERHAPIMLALLGAPTTAAGAAPATILARRFRLSAAITAPLGRR